MRLVQLSMKLLSFGVLAMLGAGGCSSDYGLFNVEIRFADAENLVDYQNVELCSLSVTDDKGVYLLREYFLEYREVVYKDPGGNMVTAMAGCSGGVTPKHVDYVSFSTSRTSGQLTFTANAYKNNNEVVQTGSAKQSIKVFHGGSDEQHVDVVMSLP
jgi:hypothetical protein